ncbi:MAG: aminotransferase class I/II-fold pyridoxal phosphate-dependent enzyme [Bacteroidota bacterium]
MDTFSKTYAMTGWRIGFAVARVIQKTVFLKDTILDE